VLLSCPWLVLNESICGAARRTKGMGIDHLVLRCGGSFLKLFLVFVLNSANHNRFPPFNDEYRTGTWPDVILIMVPTCVLTVRVPGSR